jgi:hypothetical protein
MRGRKLRLALVTCAVAVAATVAPSGAFGQAAAGSGSAASEYGDYVPNTAGTPPTPRIHADPKPHAAPKHTAPQAKRHTAAPTGSAAPAATARTTPRSPVSASVSKKPARAHHKRTKHRKRHAPAQAHNLPAPKPAPAVPAAHADGVDGGSAQLLWLGLAMLSMTVAVFARAGLRRRDGSA